MGTAPVSAPAIDPRYVCFRLAIRPSAIHRYGVYAEERIPANRKVVEYTGQRINRLEAKRRGEGAYTYLFAVNPYWTVDVRSSPSTTIFRIEAAPRLASAAPRTAGARSKNLEDGCGLLHEALFLGLRRDGQSVALQL